MKKILFPSLFFWSFLVIQTTSGFSDVPLTSPSYENVAYMSEQKAIGGYPDGTFAPLKLVNRAEALKMLFTAAEIDVPAVVEQKFKDVPVDAWFAKYVSYAANNNIISGDSTTGNFSPEREVNRAEFMKMLVKTFEVDPAKFTLDIPSKDVPSDAWFSPFINFAVKFKIIDQNQNGEALPAQAVSRGEAADIIFRTLDKGKALKPQILLSLTESHLIKTIEFLENKQPSDAGIAVTHAEGFVGMALKILPQNNVVLAANKTTQAVKNLVGAYTAGENGKLNDIITATGNAWSLADEAGKLNPNQLQMTESIKTLAHSLAEKTREVQTKVEEAAKTQGK